LTLQCPQSHLRYGEAVRAVLGVRLMSAMSVSPICPFFFFWRRCCSYTLARLVGTGDILRYAREIQFLRRKATFQLDSCSILQAEAWETQGVVPFELSVDMPICSGRRRTTKSKVCGHRWPISYLPSLPRSHRRSHVPFHDVPVVRCARALFFLYSFLGRPLRQARWCPP
jgi:hypothetical protein